MAIEVLMAGINSPSTAFGELNVAENRAFIQAAPQLNFVVQARVTGGASSNITASLVWYEDL